MANNYNRDIMEWETFPEYDAIHTDPPWGASMVKWFQNKMLKDVGTAPSHTIEAILEQLAKKSDPSKLTSVAYSKKGSDVLIHIMESHRHRLISVHEMTQENGNPYLWLTFNKPLQVIDAGKGYVSLIATFRPRPEQVFFDPFAGIGRTARAFRAAGKTYIGSELNPARYARLIKENPE